MSARCSRAPPGYLQGPKHITKPFELILLPSQSMRQGMPVKPYALGYSLPIVCWHGHTTDRTATHH